MCAAWPVADLPLPALELPRPDAAQPTPFWGLEGGSPIRAESEMRPFGDASLDPPPSVLGKRSHTVSHTISLRPRMEKFRSASGRSSPSRSRQTPRHPGLGSSPRRALTPPGPGVLKTVPKAGYCFKSCTSRPRRLLNQFNRIRRKGDLCPFKGNPNPSTGSWLPKVRSKEILGRLSSQPSILSTLKGPLPPW